MFHRTLPFAAPVRLLAQEFAFSTSFRKNSNSVCHGTGSCPDLMVVLMMPPMKLPNSAEALFVIMLNSSMASTLGE